MTTRRQLASRSRTAVLVGFLGFVGLQAALAAAVEWQLPRFRYPDFGLRCAWLRQRLARADPAGPVVVMFGTSRTQWVLDAASVETNLAQTLGARPVVFNFGVAGAGPATYLVLLHELLRAGVRADLILVEIWPPTLARNSPAQLPTAKQLCFGEVPLLRRCGFKELTRSDWLFSRAVPWYTYRDPILSQLFPRSATPDVRERDAWLRTSDPAGWLRPPERWPERPKLLERDEHNWPPWLQQLALGGPHCQAFRKLLGTCRREKLRCALVYLPESSKFRSWYPPQAERQFREFVDGLTSLFGVSVVNARGWVGDEDFLDHHHVMLRGARVFSERFGREALLPLLRKEGRPQPPR